MMLTKSFSPRVSKMVMMVCLAMVIRRPFMLPLTSTMMTMSLGDVAAWMYLYKEKNTREQGECMGRRNAGRAASHDTSQSITCTMSIQGQAGHFMDPSYRFGSSTHSSISLPTLASTGSAANVCPDSAKSDNSESLRVNFPCFWSLYNPVPPAAELQEGWTDKGYTGADFHAARVRWNMERWHWQVIGLPSLLVPSFMYPSSLAAAAWGSNYWSATHQDITLEKRGRGRL